MRKFLYIVFTLLFINGCGKNSLIITPDEEEQKVEVNYLNETESVIDFLNCAQTGILTSEMMNPPGLIVLSYSKFIDESGNTYDTTLAYAVFRDLSSPPINIGRWREGKGLDIGEVYLENIKLEKSTRKLKIPSPPHGRMDTALGFEYKLKIQNFDFKHSSSHKFQIVDKSGNKQILELNTPDKKEIETLSKYDKKRLKIKFKTKTDSLNIIISTPVEETFKPIMILKMKNLSDSEVKIDSTVINLIPAEYRQNYLLFSIVDKQQKEIFLNINIAGYPRAVLGFASSTIYFKVDPR